MARLSPAELEQRRTAALRHGAYSANQIKNRARAHRRRLLRQMRVRAGDLDALALAYLDGWARALAKLDAYDSAGLERHPHEYHAAMNPARLWLVRLEARLREVGLDHPSDDSFEQLGRHLAAKRGGMVIWRRRLRWRSRGSVAMAP